MTRIYWYTNLCNTKSVPINIPLYQHAAGALDCSHKISYSIKDIFVKSFPEPNAVGMAASKVTWRSGTEMQRDMMARKHFRIQQKKRMVEKL